MQSQIIAMLIPEGSPGAALWVRRAGGQFAFERIDARVAVAARAAARWLNKNSPHGDPTRSVLEGPQVV